VGVIHLKLRQEGELVNYKRVKQLYQEERLQVRRRKRKKVPMGERQPLLRPAAPNEVWSMDFVFDRTADGRIIKCLTVVDDATHEAVVIEVERAISGIGVARVIDRLALTRGLPKVIRSDNGKEFCDKGMVAWAHERGVQLRLIEPGKPSQNAYIESFNG
jgi:transposase InsO family protein